MPGLAQSICVPIDDDGEIEEVLWPGGTSPYAWHRLVNETPEKFALFCRYLDLGPLRGFDTLARTTGRDAAYLKRIASEEGWENRAKQYEQYMTSLLSTWTADLIKASDIDTEKMLSVVVRHEVGLLLTQVMVADHASLSVKARAELIRKLTVAKAQLKTSKQEESGDKGGKTLQLIFAPILNNPSTALVLDEKDEIDLENGPDYEISEIKETDSA